MEQISQFLAQLHLDKLPSPSLDWLWILGPLFLIWFLRRRDARARARIISQRDMITRIERMRGTRVLGIIHPYRREGWAFFSGREHIATDTAEEMLAVLRTLKPTQPLDIILHTPGGEGSAMLQIAHALQAHKGKKTAFVPYHAWSAGTLLALVADEIVMGEHAVLGPIDPQVAGVPAASLLRLRKEKPVEAIDDMVLLIADLAEKELNQMREKACDLIHPNHKQDGTCALTDDLVSGRVTHGYPITPADAKARGINITTDMPSEIFALVELYRESERASPVRHRDRP